MVAADPRHSRALKQAWIALGLAASLWLPGRLFDALAALPLPAVDYRYGARAQLEFLLRGLGLAGALLLTGLAADAEGAATPDLALLARRWRRLGGCLLQRAALGLLLAGVLGLAFQRWSPAPVDPARAAALLCLGLGSACFARPLSRAVQGPGGQRLGGLLLDPLAAGIGMAAADGAARLSLAAAWSLGPFAAWVSPQAPAGLQVWAAVAALEAWLWLGRPPRAGNRALGPARSSALP